MKKYIIKNCPALNLPLFEDYEEPAIKNGCMQEETGCEEICNCLIKRIVELCKINNCLCDNCDGAGYFDGCKDTDCSFYRLMQIEALLEIEEAE